MISVIAITLAAQSSMLPSVSQPYQMAVRNYASCIETKMIELEPSKAETDEIFEAAKMECASVHVDSILVIQDELDKSAPSPTDKSSQMISIEILDGVALMSKNRSRVVILRKRAGLPPIDVQRL